MAGWKTRPPFIETQETENVLKKIGRQENILRCIEIPDDMREAKGSQDRPDFFLLPGRIGFLL